MIPLTGESEISLLWTSPLSSRSTYLIAHWTSLPGCLKGTINSPCPSFISYLSPEKCCFLISVKGMPTQTGVQVRNLAVSLGCLFIPLFPQQTPSVTKSSWLFYIFFFFFWFVTFSLLFWYIQKNRWSRHLSLMLWLKSISLVTNIQVTKYLSASQKALLKIPPYELYFCSFTRVVSVLTCICVCVCVCVCV